MLQTSIFPSIGSWAGAGELIQRKMIFGAAGISLLVHLGLLLLFALMLLPAITQQKNLIVETVFSEERPQEEFTQDLSLDTHPLRKISTPSLVERLRAPWERLPARSFPKPELKLPRVSKTRFSWRMWGRSPCPAKRCLARISGEKSVMGETGAVVEGYGAAMSRLTREILRMMREQRVMVVWMFDESESMKDDREQIAEQFNQVYTELGIAAKQDQEEAAKGRSRPRAGSRLQDQALLTSITGYGEKLHFVMEEPTADTDAIKKAILNVAVDPSGLENQWQSLRDVIAKYRVMAGRQERRLVIVMVTDESGDDGQFLEDALQECKRSNAPVYILGRESVFGYPYAHVRWVDPMYKLTHWLRINRGPETAYAECLQWNGFGARRDVYQSGFGPYEQVRMAKETGGIFFLLPGEEEDLTGPGANSKREFDFLDMKEYQPTLESRREYEELRARSPKFRQQIWEVIVRLNPHIDKELNVRDQWYPSDPAKFREEAQRNFNRAVKSLVLAQQAAVILEQTAPQREREGSQRWRAAYDLMHAQVYAYRVRLWQYLLAADQHVKANTVPKNPKNNAWDVTFRQELLPPDEEQLKLTKIDLKEIDDQMKRAKELYALVIKEHPGTPWADRAQLEMKQGFGIGFREVFRDPNYDRPGIKTPKF